MTKPSHDVSVRIETYKRVKTYCDGIQVPVGQEVSRWVEDHFDRLERGEIFDVEAEIRKHFTF